MRIRPHNIASKMLPVSGYCTIRLLPGGRALVTVDVELAALKENTVGNADGLLSSGLIGKENESPSAGPSVAPARDARLLRLEDWPM